MRRFDIGIAALAAAQLGIISPIYILANNISGFARADLFFILLVGAAVAVVAFLVILLALWAAATLGRILYILTRSILYFGTALVFLTGLALPLTAEAQQVALAEVAVHKTNLLIAVACAILIGAVFLTRLRGAAAVGLTVVALSVFSTSAISAFQGLGVSASHALYRASSEKNVFLLGMDGISGPIANEIIRRRPDLQEAFRDFTLFENVISAAPATMASLATVVNGDTNLRQVYWGTSDGPNHLDYEKLLPNRLESEGFHVANYAYTSFHTNRLAASALGTMSPPPSFREKLGDTVSLYRFAIARTFTPRMAFGADLTPRLIAWLDNIGLPKGERHDDLRRRLLNHTGADWDASMVMSVLDFEGYLQNLSVDLEVPAAHFTHFVHPHFPVDFDSDCTYRSDDANWHSNNQNRDGVVAETECVLSQMADFLDTVKALGIYDESLIILLSDHGFPATYAGDAYGDPDELESFMIRGQPNWGYARYTPMLAIKGFGERREVLLFDERPAILGDIARTVCAATLSEGCDHYAGYDLLSAETIPTDATYYVTIVEGPDATFLTETHETIQFARSATFLNDLNDYLTAELLTEPLGCGLNDIRSADDFNNGKSDFSSWVTWRAAGVEYLRLRRPAACPEERILLSLDAVPRGVTINGEAASFEGKYIVVDVSNEQADFITIEFDGAKPEEIHVM